jgi:hypothetical protein
VPLEQRSTTRLVLGFLVTIVLPVAAATTLIAYCLMGFGHAFGHFLDQFPFL